jgi:hypothetical protein
LRLCKRCGRAWDSSKQATRTMPNINAVDDDLEDLYALNAPPGSIAHGADFGRLSAMRSKGVRVDVSTLEQLVLAEARCHQVIYKVIAYEEQTDRKRLHGHSIVCPQRATDFDHVGFGKAALEAAFAAIRVVFVGPNGMRTKMEAAALKIDDLRLRPDVIFNFLTINNILHNGPPPPSLDEVIKMIADHGGVTAHLKEHARCVLDTTVDRQTTSSDIANVRLQAQTVQHMTQAEDSEADSTPLGEALSPSLTPIGLFEIEPQEMDAVLRGIQRVVTEIAGENVNTPPHEIGVSDAIPEAASRVLRMERSDEPLDDYGGAPDLIYKTYWPLMPLRRGFVKGKAIPDARWRIVFLYFDNRFAHNLPLLFHAANIIMRHAVNRAVTARVKTSGNAFAKFSALIDDKDFLEKLIESRNDPKGAAAREVVSRVMAFINLSSSSVPWGRGERAGETTKLIADHRYAGPGSIFYSMAPDDVHNPTTIRWAAPYTGEHTFPAQVSPEFLGALRGRQPSERTARAADGSILFEMDETSLQLLAAKNPVACAITFDHLVENVRENLLRLTNGRLKDDPMTTRPTGTFGVQIVLHPFPLFYLSFPFLAFHYLPFICLAFLCV